MIDREVKILLRKELRQLAHGGSALATAAILPIFLLGVVPALMALVGEEPPNEPIPEALRFGFLGDIAADPSHLAGAMLPMFVAMVGLILPTMMATHLLITERERRTLELLVALPVRIEQVLTAKLLATLLVACGISLPLLLVDVVVFPLVGAAELEQVVALPVLLVCALALSTSIALLLSLLAKDFRTANNLGGAFLAPTIIGSFLASFVLPGGVVRPLVISLVFAVAAVLVMRHALRTVTFEKLLS